ncbi:MAG TPA: ATP synthase F0 subunit B [Polyangiales bacterium]
MKSRHWLLLVALATLPARSVWAGTEKAEKEGTQEAEGEHQDHLSLRSIAMGEEAPQFWGAVVNFGLLVWLIRRLGKKPLANFLSERREDIERGILEASDEKRRAEAVFNEYTERMKTLDKELAKLRQDVAQAAERDRARIVAEAEETVARLRSDTEVLVARQTEELQAQIRREVVEAATTAAARAVREATTPEDQRRLAEEFVRELSQVNPKQLEKRA